MERATSLAAHLKSKTQLDATLTPGKGGQFDVLLDGELIASREGNFFSKLLFGGWPDPDAVAEAVLARQGEAKPEA